MPSESMPATYWEICDVQLSQIGGGVALWQPGQYEGHDGLVKPIRLADFEYMFLSSPSLKHGDAPTETNEKVKEQISPQPPARTTTDNSVPVAPLRLRYVSQDMESSCPANTKSPPLVFSRTPPAPPPRSPYRRLARPKTAPSTATPASFASQATPCPPLVFSRTSGTDSPSSTDTSSPARSSENLTPPSNPLPSPSAQQRSSNNHIRSVSSVYVRESMTARRSPSTIRWISSDTTVGSRSTSGSSSNDSLRLHRQSIASNPNRAAIHLAAGLLVWELLDKQPGADVLSLDVMNECRLRLQVLSDEFHLGRPSSDRARSGDTPDEKKEQRLFYDAVEDGYVACQFVNKLKPGMIAHISADKTTVARGWNVPQFLAAASTLGVPEKELFQPSEMLECTPDSVHRFAQTVNAVALIAGVKSSSSMVSAIKPEGTSREKQTQVQRAMKNHPYGTVGAPVRRASTSTPNLHIEDRDVKRTHTARSPKHGRAGSVYQSRPTSLFIKAEKFDYSDGSKDMPSAENISPNSIAKVVFTIRRDDGKPPMHFQLSNCVIGRGRLGSVYRAVNLETGELVAVKRIPLRGMSEDEIRRIMEDVDLFSMLSHPCIVKYIGAYRDANFLNVVQELANRGSLGQTLKTFGKLTERLTSSYVTKILDALSYLHRMNIVHGDLKSSKILTTKMGELKLSFTFGVSGGINRQQSHDIVGTPNFLAPELIEQQGASPASDIWALACTIIELLTGRPPHSEIDSRLSAVMFRVVEDEMPPIPDECSEGLKGFLRSCFRKDPNERPDVEQLREHAWLKDSTVWSGEPRSLETLPFLRRATDQEKPTVTGAAMKLRPSIKTIIDEQDSSPSSSEYSDLEDGAHSFVPTKFEKPVICAVCRNPFKIVNGLQCSRCGSTIHTRCEMKSLEECNQDRPGRGLGSASLESYHTPTVTLPPRAPLSSTSSGTMSSLGSVKAPVAKVSRGSLRKPKVAKDDKCVVQ